VQETSPKNISILKFYVGFSKRFYVDFSRYFMIFSEIFCFYTRFYVDDLPVFFLKKFHVGEVSVNH